MGSLDPGLPKSLSKDAVSHLKVMDLIQFFVRHLKGHIMGCQRLFLEIIGQPIIFIRQAGPQVEIPLLFKHRFAQIQSHRRR